MSRIKISTVITLFVLIGTIPIQLHAMRNTSQDAVQIYVAGSEDNDNDHTDGRYWLNGKAVVLRDTTQFSSQLTVATDIEVHGKNVYVAGYSRDIQSRVAKYWINNKAIQLGDGIHRSTAFGIAVSGNDVYVAGQEARGYNLRAKLWKNGVGIELVDPAKYKGNNFTGSTAHAVAVDGKDVYVVGTDDNNSDYNLAMIWKNGKATQLNKVERSGEAWNIVIANGNIYVCGRESNQLVYWKNGTRVVLTEGVALGEATAIAVNGTDVYVSGSYLPHDNKPRIACYWKNGKEIRLPSATTNNTYATGIAIHNGDVYVCGFEFDLKMTIAKYWKNGKPVAISDGTKNAFVYSIVIK